MGKTRDIKSPGKAPMEREKIYGGRGCIIAILVGFLNHSRDGWSIPPLAERLSLQGSVTSYKPTHRVYREVVFTTCFNAGSPTLRVATHISPGLLRVSDISVSRL